MTVPVIETKRLLLRPYYAGMVTDQHVAWLNDPEVVKYSEQRHKKHTLESTHIYVNDLWTNSGSKIWGIYIKGKEAHILIGTITAHTDTHNAVSNVGILIGDKANWGKGYGAESWQAVCNWLFDHGDIRKIEMGCHFMNRGMRNLAELSGFHLEGVRHDHFVVDGDPQDLLLYAKMKPESVKVSVDERSSEVLGKTG